MSILKAIIKTVVEIPLAAAKDVLTLGGAATDGRASLPKKYKEILDELDDD
jgi:hypothetical protein